MGENFLQEDIIRERVAAATISARVGAWLAEPAHARRVVDEVAEVAVIALGKVRDDHVADLVTHALVPRFREEPISPLLGTTLMEVLRDDLHHGLVDLAVDELHSWLRRQPRDLHPGAGGAGAVVGAAQAQRRGHLAAARAGPGVARGHPRRPAPPRPRGARLDAGAAAHDLLNDEETVRRTEALKERLLEHPQVVTTAISLWKAMRSALLSSIRDPEGAVRQRLLAELSAFAEQLRDDAALRERLDRMAADLTVFAVERYGAEVTTVITSTIERWDGKEAARRIELHVGRDLQFIRINGTIVGGLVGVLIHAISLVVL